MPHLRFVPTCLLGAAAAIIVACLIGAAPAVAGPSLNVELIANINDDVGYNDIWGYSAPDGTELVVLGTVNGTAFYDVTTPEEPERVGFVPGPASVWRDIKTYRNYCYVVTETRGAGLQIVDLANPRQPRLVNAISQEFTRAHNIFIEEKTGRAYVCGSDSGTVIYDLTANPEQPQYLGSYTGHYVHDLYVEDNIAYLASVFEGRLIIVDLTEPALYRELANVRYPGAATHNVWKAPGSDIVVTTDEVAGGQLRVWDLSNLNRVRQLSSYRVAATSSVHNAFMRGDLCFMSYYTEGLRVVSLRDPSQPVEVGAYDTYDGFDVIFAGMWGVYPFGRDPSVIYCSDVDTGLYIVRFDDPTAGVLVDHEPLRDTNDPTRRHVVEASIASTGGALTEESAFLYYRVDNQPEAVIPMQFVETTVEGMRYTATIPAQSIGSVVRYTVEASDSIGKLGYSPADGPRVTHNFVIGGTSVLMNYDMDAEAGWSVDAGTATAGAWERVQPVGNGRFEGDEFVAVIPENDHSGDADGYAWVTENESRDTPLGEHDVDHGETYLVSPEWDLHGHLMARLNYWLWFSNTVGGNGGSDPLTVEVSSDGGATWTLADRVIDDTGGAWRLRTVDLGNVVDLTDRVRVRFIARDDGASSLIEAAIDDVTIETVRRMDPKQLPSANPVVTDAGIRYRLSVPTPVRVRIYDVRGRLVRTIDDGVRSAGEQVTIWDGRNQNGARMSSGVYFYRLNAGETIFQDKIAIRR